MAYQITPELVSNVSILFITFSLAAYGALQYHRQGHRPELVAFISFMLALSLWELTNIFIEAVTSPALKLLGSNFINAVVLWFVLYSLLWFALAYSDNSYRMNPWITAIAIIIIIINSIASIVAPEYLYEVHGLVTRGPVTVLGIRFEQWVNLDREIKPTFQLILLSGYLISLISAGILYRYLIRNRGEIYTGQAIAITVGIGTPVVLNFPIFVRILPPELNPIEISFGVTAIAFAVAIFRYRLLRVVPAGRRQLVDTMSDPFVMIDGEGGVVDCNPAARELVDAPVGWRGMAAESFFEPFPEQYEQFAGKTSVNTEISLMVDGTTRHFDLDISPIENTNNNTTGQLIVLRDITAQKERESELRETKRELERSNKKLDQFAATISHDLRNPLEVASGRVALLKEDLDSEHLDAIEQAHERMEAMIEDLLTLSRAGVTVEEPQTIELQTAVNSAWDHTDTVEATLDLAVPDEMSIRADKDRLLHLFENLFRNAIDHNDPPVTIRVGILDPPTPTDSGTTAGFFVEDDGDGIPAEIRDEIFDSGYTTSTDGTGFGLAIVAEIVEAHGWTIHVTESSDGGARFEITETEFVA